MYHTTTGCHTPNDHSLSTTELATNIMARHKLLPTYELISYILTSLTYELTETMHNVKVLCLLWSFIYQIIFSFVIFSCNVEKHGLYWNLLSFPTVEETSRLQRAHSEQSLDLMI
jgi:hypothetical protein